MRNLKKLTAMLLAVLMTFTSTDLTAFASTNNTSTTTEAGESISTIYGTVAAAVSSGSEETEEESGAYANGTRYIDYVPAPLSEQTTAELPSSYSTLEVATTASTIPSKYNYTLSDLADYPALRDQNPYGTCWAFATIAGAEISILTQEEKSVDLSVTHLVNFMYDTPSSDPIGGLAGDSNFIGSDVSDTAFDLGGSMKYSSEVMANWIGAASADDYPYSNATTVEANGLDESAAFDDVAHLRNCYYVNLAEDPDSVKEMIMEYGVVGVSYYDADSYYNSSHNAYYCQNAYTYNHGVTIVGWNDDFPASYFNTTPDGNGAWLIRNSWGGSGFSHYGYFWISYYDKTISDTAYVFDFVSDENDEYYDNNYQYDGAACTYYYDLGSSTIYEANVFDVNSNNEELKAVSFETGYPDLNYTVYVYTDLTSSTDPQSGTLVATKSGTSSFEGIYTVPLDEAIDLGGVEDFSVVVEFMKAGDYNPIVTFECDLTEEDYGNSSAWFECEAAISAGQSFYKKGTSSTWTDMYVNKDYGYGNIRIKAYTNDTVAVTGLSIDQGSSTSVFLGGNYQLTATVTPSNAKNQTVTWTSSNTGVVSVDSDGKLTLSNEGTATITAKVIDGSNIFTDTITVNVVEDESIIENYSLTSITDFAATGTTSGVSLTWSSAGPADTYEIYRSTNGSSYTKVGSTTSLTYTDTSVANDTTYYYYVKAVNDYFSLKSNTDTAYYVSLEEPEFTIANAASGVTVSWDAVDGADGYYVFRKTASSNWSTLAKTTATSFTDTKASSGTTYYYTVRAYAAADYGTAYSTFDTDTTIYYLAQPTVSLSNAANGVKVSWGKVTGATGYYVFRRTASSNWSTVAKVGSTTTAYTDTKASSGTTYYYTVRAFNGTKYSSFNTTTTIKYLAQPTVTLTNASNGVKISWGKVTGASGYYVFRRTAGTSWSTMAKITSGSTVTWTDGKASSGTTYYYTVRAFYGSTYSNFITTKSIKYLKQPAVSMVRYGSSVKVNWTPVTGASGYYVFRKTSSTNWTRIATVAGQSRGSYIDTTAVKGTKYWYTVRAYSGSTYSSFTTSKYITKTW